MVRFSIRNPYLIVVICLIVAVIGVTCVARMPIDLFPDINIPQVVVATFYNGMPPEEVETEITGRFERFFTLGSGIEHIESRSLPGVSIIQVYFQPGTDADSDVTTISNLAMANLRRLPPGTLPPVVLKFGGSSLPLCLVTLKGQGLSESQLRDLGQFTVRNQLATVQGASVPPPFGGMYRQIMIYADPLKLQAYRLSPMDVVRSINDANLILPAGDARIGPYDYSIYTNSQIQSVGDIAGVALKTEGTRSVTVADIGRAEDSHQIQTNVVRVDGQRSVYLPILKQGGNTNTISVVDGIRDMVGHLNDVPKSLVTSVSFDQSLFVKAAILTVLAAALVGLALTCLMVPLFFGSLRATLVVFLSVPLSVLATFVPLYMGGSSINTMILGGIALAFSRVIFNAIVVLENIFRHLEAGEDPERAAAEGGEEMALPVLAATLGTAIVFFPVTFLYGVSRFLFSALALAVVLALFASYIVALTVIPLFCARWLRPATAPRETTRVERLGDAFTARFHRLLDWYEVRLRWALDRPKAVVGGLLAVFVASLALYPLLTVAFFPRSDAGQFVINLKLPSGTRIDRTEALLQRVEALVRGTVSKDDLASVVANIGVVPDFSSIYTSNSGPHTATLQVALTQNHRIGSYQYMDMIRARLAREVPETSAFLQPAGLQDSILNRGLPAPIDVQISGADLESIHATADEMAEQIRRMPNVSETFIPTDLDYPALQLNVNRQHAAELGLTQREVVTNVITALTSNGMIAPSYWIDPKSGNDYMLTVQYPESQVKTVEDLKSIPLHSGGDRLTTLDTVASMGRVASPTEVDHYQIQRIADIYVSPASEDLGAVSSAIQRLVAQTKLRPGVRVQLRGMVEAMRTSFQGFGLGLGLAVMLLYLVLVPPFRSFKTPLLVLLAVPLGITGAMVMLLVARTTLNVMSLMGMVTLVGVAVSNSILIMEYVERERQRGGAIRDVVIAACRTRLRPVLLTSIATVMGLLPLAMKLGTGGEVYVPLALVVIGGLILSFVSTLIILPAACVLAYR